VSLKVRHLSCGTLCPWGYRWLGHPPGGLVLHCLLVEGPGGLLLVDTGLGLQDAERPIARLGPVFPALMRPRYHPAVAHLAGMGIQPGDVGTLVLTHLDLDHAGGLSDFPEAQVAVHADELASASQWSTFFWRTRYRTIQRRHGPRWWTWETGGERWEGFEGVRALPGWGDEVLLVPLPGHSAGHCGVAVRTGDGWLLHAGDAFFHRCELEGARASWLIEAFQRFDQVDGAARRANVERLAAVSRSVRVICAHDPVQFYASE
jgi:glyoxylase-like metal-dependent hydrolase (beta-lactamase superfamily II)